MSVEIIPIYRRVISYAINDWMRKDLKNKIIKKYIIILGFLIHLFKSKYLNHPSLINYFTTKYIF